MAALEESEMGMLSGLLQGALKPASDAYQAKVARGQAADTAAAKLLQSKQDQSMQVVFSDQEWEKVMAGLEDKSWKDEYATVSLLSVINLFVLGGVLAAFGWPQVLAGTVDGVQKLVAAGVPMGFLIQAVTLAAVGLSVWRKI